MWSYLYTDTQTVGSKQHAVSFSLEHLLIQHQLGYSFKYQQCEMEMQNERTYWLQGDALTASLMWVEYVRFMKRCVFLDGFKFILPPDGRECTVLLQHNLLFFFFLLVADKVQPPTSECALLETKGPSLVAKGQFQGPQVPIGSLLNLIGWESW